MIVQNLEDFHECSVDLNSEHLEFKSDYTSRIHAEDNVTVTPDENTTKGLENHAKKMLMDSIGDNESVQVLDDSHRQFESLHGEYEPSLKEKDEPQLPIVNLKTETTKL